MALQYGVLRGRVDIFEREDNLSSPHLQIKLIDGENRAWRVPVNVLSGDGSQLIVHRTEPLQSHPIVAGLAAFPMGFTDLPAGARSATNALDYFRSPLFDWPTGVTVPPMGPGANDDLQDLISTFLRQLKAQNGELFVFGAKFPKAGEAFQPKPIDRKFHTGQGVHDVHMNQGNPHPGRFDGDNGTFQDGGLLFRFPNRVVGLFFRFQTQLLPTDAATGHPLPGAVVIPAGGSPPPPGPTTPIVSSVANPDVYIERALVNPTGADPGKEAVVIGNTTGAAVNLTGWSIVDRNAKADRIGAITLPPGESRVVVLTGAGAQLGNGGGTIQLKNPAGVQVHAVTYSGADAAEQGRYIRFNT